MLCFSYFCYAQGVPLLMVIITAAVDSQGSLEEVFLPNMGTSTLQLTFSLWAADFGQIELTHSFNR